MTTPMPALIFDCDGVLADTERDGHLPAFNQTFEHFGLPVRWSEDDYAEKLKIGGGKERLMSLLDADFIVEAQLPLDPEGQADTVASWHKHKTGVYTGLVEAGVMSGRPGIARIVAEAQEAGWALAVASTSHELSVRAVLDHAVGSDLASEFTVFAGDVVPKKKPAPDIYALALSEMGLSCDEVVVVEDSRNGLLAALAAGLRTVVTVSSFTVDEDFAGASLVVTSLGDEPEHSAATISNPLGIDIGSQVTLANMSRILESPGP